MLQAVHREGPRRTIPEDLLDPGLLGAGEHSGRYRSRRAPRGPVTTAAATPLVWGHQHRWHTASLSRSEAWPRQREPGWTGRGFWSSRRLAERGPDQAMPAFREPPHVCTLGHIGRGVADAASAAYGLLILGPIAALTAARSSEQYRAAGPGRSGRLLASEGRAASRPRWARTGAPSAAAW